MQIALNRFFTNKLCCYLFLRSVSFNVIMYLISWEKLMSWVNCVDGCDNLNWPQL